MNCLLASLLTVLLWLVSFQNYAQRKILVLGSSTSACVGPSNRADCYLDRLVAHYASSSPIVIDNRAVSGWNVYQGMPEGYIPPPGRSAPTDYFNITDGLADNPNTVLINYPSNNYDVYSVAEVMECFRIIKKTANDAGKTCFITTTQPRTGFDDAAREKLRELKDSILLQFGTFAIDFWTELADPATNMIAAPYRVPGDDIHLNSAGHEILFQRVLAKNMLAATLPLSFVDVKAVKQNGKAQINWETAYMYNVARFHVQRSNGAGFNTIAEVPVQQGDHYSFTDAAPLKGNNAYRISAEDYDGKRQYSKIVNLDFSNGKPVSVAWIRQGNNISITSNVEDRIIIRVISSTGQQLMQQQVNIRKGMNNFPLSVQTQQRVEIINVSGSGWSVTTKVYR
jgi:hypothetical protein